MSDHSKGAEMEERPHRKSPLTKGMRRDKNKSQNRSNVGIPGAKKKGKGNKYQELEEDYDRCSNLSKARSDGAGDYSLQNYSGGNAPFADPHTPPPRFARRSRFEGKEGLTKVIKTQNTQQMTEILDTQNEKERKKIFETINERILNSRVTIETDNDNSDLKNADFIEKFRDGREERNIEAKKKQRRARNMSNIALDINIEDPLEDEEQNEGAIQSSLFYGERVSRHTKKVSIMNDFDEENKGTEKEAYEGEVNYENETEKVHNFTPNEKELDTGRHKSTSPKHHFHISDQEDEDEIDLDKQDPIESGYYKDNSTTQYPPDRSRTYKDSTKDNTL